MDFRLENAKGDFIENVTINSVNDLKEIYDKYKEELTVDFKDMTIIIYDDYVE